MTKILVLSGTPTSDFLSAARGLAWAERPEDAEIIVGEPEQEELSRCRNLRWVQMTWAGADRYLRGGFPENVKLTTASGAFGETIAEHALAMLFALCRRLPAYARQRTWEDLGTEKQIAGGTALIFGAGNIGSAIARRLKALDVRTVGVCRNLKKVRPDFDFLTDLPNAEGFLPEADFVLCALPHNQETAGYFNEQRLQLLKKGSVFINVGRGSLVNTDALTEHLSSGHLFGAGLDVVSPEPLPPEHPLWNLDNVIITPHVAGVSFGHLKDTENRIWAICAENLRRYRAGQSLLNEVIF